MTSISIAALGRGLPDRIVTNEELSAFVDTDDSWIVSRTGIHRRHLAEKGTMNADLAEQAAIEALERAGMQPSEIDALVVATFTPDCFTPSISSTIHGRIGLREDIMSLDVNGACCGFLYALRVAQGHIALDADATVLVVASELMSGVLDFSDRSTCVLFGDGAAAAVVKAAAGASWFTAGTHTSSNAIVCRARYAPAPVPGLQMQGQEVFRFACKSIEHSIAELLERAGLRLEDVDHIVCHQANARIIEHVIKHLGARPGQFFMNVGDYGNTSAASIPLALADMQDRDLLKRGDTIVLVGFGAGLAEGGMLFTW